MKTNFFDFFETEFINELQSRKRTSSTISSYRLHVHRFRVWCKKQRLKRKHVKPRDITHKFLKRFRDHLRKRYSIQTANKCVSGIQAILRFAMEHDLIDHPVRLRPLECSRYIAKKTLRFWNRDDYHRWQELQHGPLTLAQSTERDEIENRDELSRLYMAAYSFETWPSIDQASLYWRTAILLYCTYGFRTCELIPLSDNALKWSNVHFEKELPNLTQARSEFGWLVYVPAKQKRFKPNPLCLPLTRVARDHLQALPRSCDFVLPFPKNKARFYQSWREIIRRADLDRELLVKHMRKTAATWTNFWGDGIGRYVCGHAERDVHARHYSQQQFELVEGFKKLPTPKDWGLSA